MEKTRNFDFSKIVPAALEADFPVGTKGFTVRLRHLHPGEIRRMMREAVDVDAGGKPRFSSARHELLVSQSAVRGWKGLTAEAFAELVPSADIDELKAQLPDGGEIGFDHTALKALMEHSEVFYAAVNSGGNELKEFRRARQEREIKNSGASPERSSLPDSSAAADAGN